MVLITATGITAATEAIITTEEIIIMTGTITEVTTEKIKVRNNNQQNNKEKTGNKIEMKPEKKY